MNRYHGTVIFLCMTALSLAPLGAAQDAKKSADQYMGDLNNSDPAIQIEGARQLGAAREEKAISSLIQLLETTRDREVRFNAAMALGAIGKKGTAMDALLIAAKNMKYSKATRYASLLGLANIQDADRKDELKAIMEWTRENSDDTLAKDLVERFINKHFS